MPASATQPLAILFACGLNSVRSPIAAGLFAQMFGRTVYVGSATDLDCGGAFYSTVQNGYQVVPPPIGSTVSALPSGAVDQNIDGTTYFVFGGAYYRPFYSGSSVIYQVVAKPA